MIENTTITKAQNTANQQVTWGGTDLTLFLCLLSSFF